MSPFASNIVLLFACLLPAAQSAAQTSSGTASSFYGQAVQAYQSIIGYTSRLYNGSEYIRTYPNVSGHPFVASDSLLSGSIAYDGVLYKNVFLNYDIVRDEVIIKGPQVFLLKLVPEKIDSFAINGRRFIRYNAVNRHQLAKGFYEVLYSGGVWVLASRLKKISVASRTDEQAQFAPLVSYFLLKDDRLFKVTNKTDLIQALDDRKEAVKKYVSQNGLNFRENPEQVLIKVALFYDQIPN